MAEELAGSKSSALHAIFHPVSLFFVLLVVSVHAIAGSATLAWGSVNSSALAGYMLYYGPSAGNYPSKIDVGKTTSRTVTNLTEGASYHFAVKAYDASHSESGFSNDVSTTIPYSVPVANFVASTTSGIAPLAMNFTNTSTGSISTYAWMLGDGATSTAKAPSHVYSVAGVYTVSLTVTGPGGKSTKTIPNYVTVKAATTSDTLPPTAPSSLVATAGGSTSINLSWKASTDNVGVTGYRIERCQGAGCTAFVQIATSTGTAITNSTLIASTSYSYRVRAVDAAGKLSAYSNTATAKTNSTADTSPPTAPSSLVATAGGSTSIKLSWRASTDNVGVTGYRIERCQGVGCTAFVQIATSTGTTITNSGLIASTSYSYRVRAADAAGKLSAYSNTATAKAALAPTLTGSWVLTSGDVDLTSIGSSDWAFWPGHIRNASGGAQIANIVMLGGGVARTYSGDNRTMTWRNGTPTLAGTSSSAVLVSGSGNGFQFTVPADTTTRTLIVYVRVQNGTGTLTAHLSDGSATDYVKAYSAPTAGYDGVFTLKYRAASAGRVLTVKWTQTGSSLGNVGLQGAALIKG